MSRRRTWMIVGALVGVLALGGAAAGFRWHRTHPRCDPEPLESLGTSLAATSPAERMAAYSQVYEAIAAACPVVSHELWMMAAAGTLDANPRQPDAVYLRRGSRVSLGCGPERWEDAWMDFEGLRACAREVGFPETLYPEYGLLRSQLFLEREGVSREAAQALTWVLHGGSDAPLVPVVAAWSTAEPEHAEHHLALTIAPELPSSTLTEHSTLGGEDGRRVLVRALSIVHGEAYPTPTWLTLDTSGFRGARPPCVELDDDVVMCPFNRVAAELGPQRLWLADGGRRVELRWSNHDELAALLRDDPRLAWARARPAWIALTDARAIEWRSLVALVDFFAPIECTRAPKLELERRDPSELELPDPCAEPFARLFLGERVVKRRGGGE